MAEAPEPERQDRLKSAATWPRLFALALAVLAASAMFELRSAALRPAPVPDKPEGRTNGTEHWTTGPDGRRSGYTADELHEYFKGLGPDGRALYAGTQKTLDVFFPLVYGSLFLGVLARAVPGRSRWRWWAWAPVCMVLADLGENALLAHLAEHFPAEPTPGWAETAVIAAKFTGVKWALYDFILYFLGPVALLWRGFDCFPRVAAWWRTRRPDTSAPAS
jgi:hypothetical protein